MGNKNINMKTGRGVSISTVGVDIGDWTFERKKTSQVRKILLQVCWGQTCAEFPHISWIVRTDVELQFDILNSCFIYFTGPCCISHMGLRRPDGVLRHPSVLFVQAESVPGALEDHGRRKG